MAGSVASKEARAASSNSVSNNLPPNVPEWMKTPGAPVGGQRYGLPSPFEKAVVRNVPKSGEQSFWTSSRTPLQELDGIITSKRIVL
jgi:sulfane dehydrogenase subunit SoxC